MFQLTQLRCFVAVATELHFGRAAVSLNMTQPPLTRQIQLLEHEVGVRLLERAGGAVRLTPPGTVFLREAEDILRRSQAATLAARRALRADAGSVTMAFIPAASFSVLPGLLTSARERLPEVELVLREMQTADQLEAIGADRVELGIVRPFAPRNYIESAVLFREPFVAAVPNANALARLDAIPVSALQDQPFIAFCPSESRYLYELVAGRMREEGVAPATVQTLSHTHSIISLVDAGLGVALVPRSSARLAYAGVSFRPLRVIEELNVELHLAWRRGTRHLVADTLRRCIQSTFPVNTIQVMQN